MFTQDLITGTLINYYVTCKREAWLYAHHIHADQSDANILMGKSMAELKESKLQDFPDIGQKQFYIEIIMKTLSIKIKVIYPF